MARGTDRCARPTMNTVVEYLPAGKGGGPVDLQGGNDVAVTPPGWRHRSYLVRTVTGNRLAPGASRIEGGQAINVLLAR
jgi:hypothetical protein